MRDEYLRWQGQRIHVQCEGEGEPMLLINGLGGNTDMWEPLIRSLGERQVMSFDAPGAGRSSTPHFPVMIGALAELAVRVLDVHDIESCNVLGYSYGGAVAQQMAFDFPDRVMKLVLAATTCGVGAVPGSARAMSVLSTPFRYYSPTYFDRIAQPAYGGRTGRNPEIRKQMMEKRQQFPPTTFGYSMQILGGATWSSCHFLDEIEQETLIIVGDDDPLIPLVNAEMLASRIRNSTLEIVERAGHLFLWDDAENMGQRIVRFLDA